MQVVVAQRGGAQRPRASAQLRVFGGELGEFAAGVAQQVQGRRGAFVVAACGGQARLQEPGPPRVAADHARVLGVGGHARIGDQAVLDAPDRFLDAVVGAARQVDLAKLGKHFQHEIVSVVPFDARYQGQQQIAGAGLVGR